MIIREEVLKSVSRYFTIRPKYGLLCGIINKTKARKSWFTMQAFGLAPKDRVKLK